MSEEKDLKQMSLLEGSRANLSPLQEKEKEQMMIATSGMKLLELYPSKNPNGLLAKMLKALLTSKTAWCSDRSTMIWKAKVSKCKVLLFQLAVSVRGIKGKEFGLLHTPTATEIGMRSPEAMEKRKKYRESIGRKTVPPGNLLEQIQMMYPTPHRLIYGTPTAQASRAALTDRGRGNLGEQVHGDNNAKKVGGKLNPHFVEFLMGYSMNWTKIDPTELKHSETQSFHKSQEKSEKP